MRIVVVDVQEAMKIAENEPGLSGLLIAMAVGRVTATGRPAECRLVRESIIVVPCGTTEEEIVVSLAPLREPEDVLTL